MTRLRRLVTRIYGFDGTPAFLGFRLGVTRGYTNGPELSTQAYIKHIADRAPIARIQVVSGKTGRIYHGERVERKDLATTKG